MIFKPYDQGIFSNLYGFDPQEVQYTICTLLAHDVDVDEFLYDYTPFADEDDYNTVMDELKAREAGYSNYQTAEQLGDNALNAIDEVELIHVRYFNTHSKLGEALRQWFNTDDDNVLASHLRSGFVDPETDLVFYVTGIGYDTMSSDLLGSAPDGEAYKAFIERFDR